MNNISISISKSPEENFFALASGTAITTAEYEKAYGEVIDAAIPSKIRALKITAIALVIFGCLVAATVGTAPGLLLISSAMFPLIGAKYQSDIQTVLVTKLDKPKDEISTIVKNIIDKLNQLQLDKETYVINYVKAYKTWNEHVSSSEFLKTCTDGYDKGEVNLNNTEECAKEYSKWLPHVQKVLLKDTQPIFPQDKWKELRKSCFTFLYGRGNDRDFDQGIRGIGPLIGTNPYVKVVQYGTDKWEWRAEKY